MIVTTVAGINLSAHTSGCSFQLPRYTVIERFLHCLLEVLSTGFNVNGRTQEWLCAHLSCSKLLISAIFHRRTNYGSIFRRLFGKASTCATSVCFPLDRVLKVPAHVIGNRARSLAVAVMFTASAVIPCSIVSSIPLIAPAMLILFSTMVHPRESLNEPDRHSVLDRQAFISLALRITTGAKLFESMMYHLSRFSALSYHPPYAVRVPRTGT